ncbi:hypothetical protein PIB30_058010 [Stylosanthes scabra]|uniref:Uncharacterized protein n=1 Tax=Stylosanthes scabra TaxID=79078 RepID=A0ABU6ZIJ8_9FABA|nr:hypothetical protein [Stylosanthes scabra]
MKERFKQVLQLCHEALEYVEEEEEKKNSGECVIADYDNNEVPPQDNDNLKGEEVVSVELADKCLRVIFKCPCGKGYVVLLSRNTCYYESNYFLGNGCTYCQYINFHLELNEYLLMTMSSIMNIMDPPLASLCLCSSYSVEEELEGGARGITTIEEVINLTDETSCRILASIESVEGGPNHWSYLSSNSCIKKVRENRLLISS